MASEVAESVKRANFYFFRLSLVVVSRGYSLLRCTGFSLRWLLLLWTTGSRHTGFSRCGMRAQ